MRKEVVNGKTVFINTPEEVEELRQELREINKKK
jgi:hypothetical protein